MKRSKPWLTLIPIALALLLNGVRSASAVAVKPIPRATPQTRREGTTDQKPTSHHTSTARKHGQTADAFSAPSPNGQAEESATKVSNKSPSEEERHNRREEALEQNLVWLTAILATVNGVTFIVFLVTMLANVRAANGARHAADAAWEQAKLATAAITIERPYLLVRSVGFEEHASRGMQHVLHLPAPIVTFTNYGRTPALIEKVVLTFEPVECEDWSVSKHAHRDLGTLFHEGLPQKGVPSNGDVEFKALTKNTTGFEVDDALWKELTSLERVFIVFGKIGYRSVLESKSLYATDFCWYLDVTVKNRLIWTVGPAAHNAHS